MVKTKKNINNDDEKEVKRLKDGESAAIILLALVVGYFFLGIIGAIVGVIIGAFLVNKYRIKK
jgi:hypothetical protein